MKNKFIIWMCIISITAVACNFNQQKPQVVNLGDEENYIIIADTLVSDVVILNPDNDEWTEYCLRRLDKKTLVNEIFKSVYTEELIPYEFFNNNPLSIEDIKTLESDPEFSRDNIAKVQFEEAWYFDPTNQKMIKKVHSIMLAYEIYDSFGEIRGYKPAFKVYMK
ncbi:MAG: hypothetical protein PF485_00265 [Bacteroidales bacterium]|jgi:hypothetical protein|nr:hypothetical protein [Bacteroidales bacterium]